MPPARRGPVDKGGRSAALHRGACCPFLTFDLTVRTGAVALEVTDPAEAQPVIETLTAPAG